MWALGSNMKNTLLILLVGLSILTQPLRGQEAKEEKAEQKIENKNEGKSHLSPESLGDTFSDSRNRWAIGIGVAGTVGGAALGGLTWDRARCVETVSRLNETKDPDSRAAWQINDTYRDFRTSRQQMDTALANLEKAASEHTAPAQMRTEILAHLDPSTRIRVAQTLESSHYSKEKIDSMDAALKADGKYNAEERAIEEKGSRVNAYHDRQVRDALEAYSRAVETTKPLAQKIGEDWTTQHSSRGTIPFKPEQHEVAIGGQTVKVYTPNSSEAQTDKIAAAIWPGSTSRSIPGHIFAPVGSLFKGIGWTLGVPFRGSTYRTVFSGSTYAPLRRWNTYNPLRAWNAFQDWRRPNRWAAIEFVGNHPWYSMTRRMLLSGTAGLGLSLLGNYLWHSYSEDRNAESEQRENLAAEAVLNDVDFDFSEPENLPAILDTVWRFFVEDYNKDKSESEHFRVISLFTKKDANGQYIIDEKARPVVHTLHEMAKKSAEADVAKDPKADAAAAYNEALFKNLVDYAQGKLGDPTGKNPIHRPDAAVANALKQWIELNSSQEIVQQLIANHKNLGSLMPEVFERAYKKEEKKDGDKKAEAKEPAPASQKEEASK